MIRLRCFTDKWGDVLVFWREWGRRSKGASFKLAFLVPTKDFISPQLETARLGSVQRIYDCSPPIL
jgi:hypothetical protein